MSKLIKKGDRLLVWSLQSFSHGGFLNGEPAFAKQNQHPNGSVIICVIRNFNGEYKIDESYEVYRKQVKKVNKNQWNAKKKLKKLRKKIINNDLL